MAWKSYDIKLGMVWVAWQGKAWHSMALHGTRQNSIRKRQALLVLSCMQLGVQALPLYNKQLPS